MALVRNLFRRANRLPRPTIPPGQRIYAVGDIHGRLDLLNAMLSGIENDEKQHPVANSTLIFLGDLIDRGPDSAEVVARIRALATQRSVRCLMGNHEEMFLQSLTENEALRHFLKVGGRETVLSYGVSRDEYPDLTLNEVRMLVNHLVPSEDILFIKGFSDSIIVGDYLFVHAGIRPQIALEDQDSRDLRWIREPFLSHTGLYEKCVIHGHTITQDVEIKPGRIGIDTGAYTSGCLTTIGLEDDRRWVIQAQTLNGGDINVTYRSIC